MGKVNIITREPQGDLPPHNQGDLTESTPCTIPEGSRLCHRILRRCPLHVSHRNQKAKAEV